MTAAPALAARRKLLILACMSATSSLIMLDSNIVAVALPTIARELHARFDGVEWVISAYLLTFATLLLPAGSLADRFGRRRIVTYGLTMFLAASAICGLSSSVLTLEIARAVQGIGGAMLLTAALAVIASTFRGDERAKAYAFWGTSLGIAITLGPIAGGLITGLFGWRWVFLINVPLCGVFVAAILRIVPESRDREAQGLDYAGFVTLSGGLFALVAALIDGNRLGWTSSAIILRLVAAATLLSTFVLVEFAQRRPMLDLRLVARRGFVGATCGTFGYGTGAQVMIYLLPLYLQGRFGFSAIISGFALLPFALPLFLAPRIVAKLLHDWSHRGVLLLGLGITAAGNLLLAASASLDSYVATALAMAIVGAGAGILNPETAKATQAQMPPERAGMGSGIGATTRFISLLLGVALLGAMMAQSGFAAAAGMGTGLALLAAWGVAALTHRPAPLDPQLSLDVV